MVKQEWQRGLSLGDGEDDGFLMVDRRGTSVGSRPRGERTSLATSRVRDGGVKEVEEQVVVMMKSPELGGEEDQVVVGGVKMVEYQVVVGGVEMVEYQVVVVVICRPMRLHPFAKYCGRESKVERSGGA